MIKISNDRLLKPIPSNKRAPFYANLFPTSDFNGKYARIVGGDGAGLQKYSKQIQDDILFRTQSQEKISSDPLNEVNSNGSFLFIAGSWAPIWTVKEKKVTNKAFKAPLPKTKRIPTDGKESKDSVGPLQGFGWTNSRLSLDFTFLSWLICLS